MDPAEARAVFDQAVTALDGRPFAPHELGEVLAATGYTRAWLHKVLRERVEAGGLEHDRESGTYRQTGHSPLPDTAPGPDPAAALVEALRAAGVDLQALLRALRDQS
ncbi:hypothetical protein Ssi03_76830 [Sphaerisporangium siamense]|uniref:Ser/Thr protein kinase RdoA (MazF antagonist) n=1 Tax=Sphaerisporangium siamense TaxID=795645 RepID=A0A7W7DG01_9ACTN|nr:hypothetical protein [Sphaerisporangium siamense]MBB4706169.1 Ser/Thr protein kinase RdoA (MazF antagonist) [Sphaerisporangium siamense]GII89693.1 hypothetical protein Ssi03_76830 [Sphaerisporangium siamense]